MDITLTGCKSKSGQSRPFSITYSFEEQFAAEIDSKCVINSCHPHFQNAICSKFAQFQFLHFNAEYGNSKQCWAKYLCPESMPRIALCSARIAWGKVRAYQSLG